MFNRPVQRHDEAAREDEPCPCGPRFARGAVAGFALAGLTACDGSSFVPIPILPQEMTINPGSYVSVSYGTHSDRRGWSWAFGTGTSAAAAEREAQRRCSDLLGSTCDRALSGATNVCVAIAVSGEFSRAGLTSGATNVCVAIAVSECPARSCGSPAVGRTTKSTRQEAESVAIRLCEQTGGDGTCRIATSDDNEPGVLCVGTAR